MSTRGEKNKKRHREQVARKVKTATCDLCGGQATYCKGCEMYSSYCCEEYGTCLCS